jgi:hypothetical protein
MGPVNYQVSSNHVLADFLMEVDDLLREVLGDLVVKIEVQKDLTGARPPNAMDVLQRVLHPLVIWDLNTANTNALNLQDTMTNPSLLSCRQWA